MLKTFSRYLFSSSGIRDANIEEYFKKGSNFEQQERKYANTWGSGGRARGHKSLSKITSIMFLLCFFSFPKVATEQRIHNFAVFRTVITFGVCFWHFLIFIIRWKSPKLFSLKSSFHWWKPFWSCCIYNIPQENWRLISALNYTTF